MITREWVLRVVFRAVMLIVVGCGGKGMYIRNSEKEFMDMANEG